MGLSSVPSFSSIFHTLFPIVPLFRKACLEAYSQGTGINPAWLQSFDQIDWENVKFLDDPQYKLDPEMVEQTQKFYAWLNSTEGAQILNAIKTVAHSPEMQELLQISADYFARGANTLDNITMAVWTEAGPVADIPVALTYSGEIIFKGTSKALSVLAEKCGNFAIKEVTFTSKLLTNESGAVRLFGKFPKNPNEFNPAGLEKKIYNDGNIIKWQNPKTGKSIYEWNADAKYGDHYHFTPDGKSRIPHPETNNTHIQPGQSVPREE